MRQSLSQIYDRQIAEGALQPDPAQRALLPRLEELRAWLEQAPPSRTLWGGRGLMGRLWGRTAPPQPKGLYLWGDVGRGKSMLMDLFYSAAEIPGKRRIHFHAFMQEIHRALHRARQQGHEDALAPVAVETIRGLRLLALDEMQITDITDAMIVGRLFEKLFAAGVSVVTTSNRPPEDLYKDGLNRQLFLPFIEMLNTRLEVCALESPKDYRQHRLQGAQVYFQPADAHAHASLARLWDELTGAAHGQPLELCVDGRRFELARTANGVAWLPFEALCARPLGPADYLALADAVRVLILEGIPFFTPLNYDEARRFVILIDALYERKVRLICSASDLPERLYPKGRGAFEFARTASRLQEMQSASWGQEP